MANRIDTPLVALLSLGFVLSAITVVFPSPSALALVGIILAYPAYWALDIRHALAVRLYRSQALGIGLVSIAFGVLFTYFAIFNSLSPASSLSSWLVVVQPLMVVFIFLPTFYWVDASVLAGRRSDPLLRDTLSWSRIRRLVWAVLIFFAALLNVLFYSSKYQSNPSALNFEILYVVVLTPLVSGSALLPIIARRSRDPSLRRHLRSFALFLVSVLVFAILFASFTAYFFAFPSGFARLGVLVWDAPLVTAAYFLYMSARSLAPLNKLSLVELTSPLGKETSLRPDVSYGQLVKASSVRHRNHPPGITYLCCG